MDYAAPACASVRGARRRGFSRARHAAGPRDPAFALGRARISLGGSHRAKFPADKRGTERLLEKHRGRLSLAYRNSPRRADRRKVVCHQGSVLQRFIARASRRIAPPGRSRPMTLRAHDAAQRGGIIAKLLVLLIVVLLCFLIYVVRAPLLRVAGNFWITPQPPAACDVIVILSDDDFTADRASRAAELYHAGWAPTIVASGRRLRPYASIAELMQKDLEARGVPAKAIVAYPHDAVDTLIELTDIRGFVQHHGWKRVMI